MKSWQNSLLCAPGSILIKTMLMKSPSEAFVVHPDRILVQTSTGNSCWQTDRFSDDGSSWSLYISKYYKQHPWGKETSCMASVLLRKYASITPVDLIQRKKLNSRKFYESARFKNYLILYCSIKTMTIQPNCDAIRHGVVLWSQ